MGHILAPLHCREPKVQSAIRQRPVSAATRHTLHSAMRKFTKPLQDVEPENVRAQERPQNWPPKLPRGAFRAVVRADSESANESGARGGPKPRNRNFAGS
eukprot:674272-Alexandrium_andersonii.AAC.1